MCAKTECDAPTVGKSKYCAPHRDAARAAWVEMIKNKPTAADKAKEHAELFDKAHAAGMAAAARVTPTPMLVMQRRNPFDDNSPIVKAYAPVTEGACGFAWVNVKPGNSSFALWLVKTRKGSRDSYTGGVSVRCHEFGQSYELKSAYAGAFAGVLQEAGIKRAYSYSRMD